MMRYLKTFENFSGRADWEGVIENNEHFTEIENLINNEPEVIMVFDDLVSKMSTVDIKMIEPLFHDFKMCSQLLTEEFKKHKTTYKLGSTMKSESIQNIDIRAMAQQALKYIIGLGIMGGLVKLFYMIGEYLFIKLDELGIYSVVGGVLLILIYLAVFDRKKKLPKEVKSDSKYTDFEEI